LTVWFGEKVAVGNSVLQNAVEEEEEEEEWEKINVMIKKKISKLRRKGWLRIGFGYINEDEIKSER
jgi:hypothetical protein